MLEINDLTHWYGEREGEHGQRGHLALQDVSLQVSEGELVSIVGPSGCGKSTLLRCVAGLIPPASGSVRLDGRLVDQVPDGLAVVFQEYSRSLLPWMRVQDNVGLPLRKKSGRRAGGKTRAERREVAARALETVGLAGVGSRYPWQLSGGMQQRVAIARALACDPALLLMDEPFGSVDAQTREDLEDLILAVRRERGMTILLVTHDIDESVYVGDRVVVLTPGPGQVRADLAVHLPAPRDQISTRELPAFVHLRATVGRLVRGQEVPAAEPPGEPGSAGERAPAREHPG
jgi:NitT/TauT family transport system ATP-binding protein